VPLGVVRGLARELARQPGWRIRWFEDSTDGGRRSLVDALVEAPSLGVPGSTFIYPIMRQVEESGLATQLLAESLRSTAADAGRDLCRIAAWSMLQEPVDHAPYGWTHCLTLSQSAVGLAGEGVTARTAVAVAATHVAGFRTALGQCHLDPDLRPDDPGVRGVDEAIAAGPDVAGAAVWHLPDGALEAAFTVIATRAAVHHDAHFVKYTLACRHAADADPASERLFLAAAARLAGWWARQADDGFFE
jgi:hypothetical protein